MRAALRSRDRAGMRAFAAASRSPVARARRALRGPARARRRRARRARRFVRAHVADLHGRVLVAGDPSVLPAAIDGARDARAAVSVWSDDPKRTDTTHVSALATDGPGALPPGAFDTVVVTDARACSPRALAAIATSLAADGVLLVVAAGVERGALTAALDAAAFCDAHVSVAGDLCRARAVRPSAESPPDLRGERGPRAGIHGR